MGHVRTRTPREPSIWKPQSIYIKSMQDDFVASIREKKTWIVKHIVLCWKRRFLQPPEFRYSNCFSLLILCFIDIVHSLEREIDIDGQNVAKKNVVVLLTAHAKSKYLSLMIDIPSMSKMLNSILFCCPDGGVNHTITSPITSHSSLYNRHLTRLFLTLFRILCL